MHTILSKSNSRRGQVTHSLTQISSTIATTNARQLTCQRPWRAYWRRLIIRFHSSVRRWYASKRCGPVSMCPFFPSTNDLRFSRTTTLSSSSRRVAERRALRITSRFHLSLLLRCSVRYCRYRYPVLKYAFEVSIFASRILSTTQMSYICICNVNDVN